MERERENGPTANDNPSLQDEHEEVNSSSKYDWINWKARHYPTSTSLRIDHHQTFPA
ncbi:hypothetical protein M378DRAFT_170143, partial [Amanita muscaria Koide BX008]